MICVMRMNPAWMLVCPKFELPNVPDPRSARTLTRLNGFSTSNLSCAALVAPRWKLLMATMPSDHVNICAGDRPSGSVRGALPNVKDGAATNAAGSSQVAVG